MGEESNKREDRGRLRSHRLYEMRCYVIWAINI